MRLPNRKTSSRVIRNIWGDAVDKINNLLGITESYQAPDAIMKILFELDEKEREEIFMQFIREFDYKITYDWFHDYFQEEHADRKTKKQDFTPDCLSELMAEITISTENGVIFEPSAGTGGTIIKAWDKYRKNKGISSYTPDSMFVVAEELSERTIPFLLFNLAIRGINGNVIHCNSLTRACTDVYHVHNVRNWHQDFSECFKLPHTKQVEKMFNVYF